MSLEPKMCPVRRQECGTCWECENYREKVAALVASRVAALEVVKKRWKRDRTINDREVDLVDYPADVDPNGYKLAREARPHCIEKKYIEDEIWGSAGKFADLAREKKRRMARDEEWARIVPQEYWETQLKLLPRPDITLAVARRLRAWDCRGIFLYGSTNAGKTRTAFFSMEPLCIKKGLRWRYIEASTIEEKAKSMARSGGGTDFCDELTNTDLLFIDDFGHGEFSNAYGEALRKILERCTTKKIKFLVTSQFTFDELLAHWGQRDPGKAKTASAIIRRLHEFCLTVKMDARRCAS
jgi:DNA replication protein DnaC